MGDEVLIADKVNGYGVSQVMLSEKVQSFLQSIGDEIASRAGPEFAATVLEDDAGRYSAAYIAIDPYTPEPEKTKAHRNQRKYGTLERALHGV